MRQAVAGGRVLVVSASMGAGHDTAAHELARRLREQGCEVHVTDVLGLGRPGQGRRLRQTYAFLLRRLPVVYDAAMRCWARWPAPLERLTARGARSIEADLERLCDQLRPDVVVSLYNLASQCLGRSRSAGRIDVPVLTYVTDPGAHPYWVHSGVDAHLTVLAATAQQLRRRGARGAVAAGPLVRPGFARSNEGRAQARRRLGLPEDGAVALVSSGAWASGGLAHAADVLASTGQVLPVVLCGADETLRRRLQAKGTARALGWVEDVAQVMAAADVLVDDAGGLTCWEALVAGLPVVLFRPLPGHGRFNARTLEQVGAVARARRDTQLLPLVLTLVDDTPARAQQVARARSLLSGDPAQHVVDLLARAAS